MNEASICFPHLGITMEHVGKTISIFGFEVAYYGIVIAFAMLMGLTLVTALAKKTGQKEELYFDAALSTIVIAVLGARLYYVAFSWENYRNNLWEIFNIRGGGLAIYGGVLAGAFCIFAFSKIKKYNFFLLCDTICPGLILGQAIGRWGNFFNREAFGGYTDSLLAMRLPKMAVHAEEITSQMMEHVKIIDGIEFIQVHPTFLYESLWNLAVLCLLICMTKRKQFHGEILALYLAGYGIGRFWIEGLRTDQLLVPGIGLPVSQILSVVLIAIAILLAMILRKTRRISEDDEKGALERRD